jgi:hypothetical protein
LRELFLAFLDAFAKPLRQGRHIRLSPGLDVCCLLVDLAVDLILMVVVIG